MESTRDVDGFHCFFFVANSQSLHAILLQCKWKIESIQRIQTWSRAIMSQSIHQRLKTYHNSSNNNGATGEIWTAGQRLLALGNSDTSTRLGPLILNFASKILLPKSNHLSKVLIWSQEHVFQSPQAKPINTVESQLQTSFRSERFVTISLHLQYQPWAQDPTRAVKNAPGRHSRRGRCRARYVMKECSGPDNISYSDSCWVGLVGYHCPVHERLRERTSTWLSDAQIEQRASSVDNVQERSFSHRWRQVWNRYVNSALDSLLFRCAENRHFFIRTASSIVAWLPRQLSFASALHWTTDCQLEQLLPERRPIRLPDFSVIERSSACAAVRIGFSAIVRCRIWQTVANHGQANVLTKVDFDFFPAIFSTAGLSRYFRLHRRSQCTRGRRIIFKPVRTVKTRGNDQIVWR
jgi:hypothetical protein